MIDIYLPIAGRSADLGLIAATGAFTGFFYGMVGVGGGFLLTPILLALGIPSAVAVGSGTNQVIATAASGAAGHRRLGNVHLTMGLLISLGALVGGAVGVRIVGYLADFGLFDLVVRVMYVLLLGGVGWGMLKESLAVLRSRRRPATVTSSDAPHPSAGIPHPRGVLWRERLPLKRNFPRLGVRISALVPIGAGMATGFVAALMGVGGAFLLMPIMIYLIGMSTASAVGTGLVVVLLSAVNATVQHAYFNGAVDAVLACILYIGSVFGAQAGVALGRRFSDVGLRLVLSMVMLAAAAAIAVQFFFPPEDLIEVI